MATNLTLRRSNTRGSDMRTRNLDEAIDAISKVYCPHTVELTGRVRNTDAVPEVRHSHRRSLCRAILPRTCNIDAENSPRLFFMMHCARGSAATIRQNRSADWRCGRTMHFSAGFDTKLSLDRKFAQKSGGWIRRSGKLYAPAGFAAEM